MRLVTCFSWLPCWLRSGRGSDLIEYALLAGLVGVAGAAALGTLPDVMNAVYASWDAATQAIWEPNDP
jgi:Flp pilus assembly pilin Flp